MKAKNIKKAISFYIIGICFLIVAGTGCKKLGGLALQENEDHITTTLDPHINMTAWDFLKSRALGTSAYKDSILYQMYLAIQYSGIDTAEYTKPGRTFIFLHNDAVNRKSNNVATTDSYFGKYKVGSPAVAATNWTQYPQIQVKNYLLSLIVPGEYSFETVRPDPEFHQTLMPVNYDPLNPQSQITFRVINDRDSRFRINDFPGSAVPTAGLATPGIQARTAGILSTNGPIHVVDRVLFYQVQ